MTEKKPLAELSEKAREQKRAYQRAYYHAHKEQCKARANRYWERRAAAAEQAQAEQVQDNGGNA